jgi:hypothetical protein
MTSKLCSENQSTRVTPAADTARTVRGTQDRLNMPLKPWGSASR